MLESIVVTAPGRAHKLQFSFFNPRALGPEWHLHHWCPRREDSSTSLLLCHWHIAEECWDSPIIFPQIIFPRNTELRHLLWDELSCTLDALLLCWELGRNSLHVSFYSVDIYPMQTYSFFPVAGASPGCPSDLKSETWYNITFRRG